MLEHGFNYTSSGGVYKYAKVLGIKKDLNPISVERQTQINRYIFTTKFITNTYEQELKIGIVLNSANGTVNYKILSTNIPSNYYQHLPIVVTTDSGCDIYLSTLKESGYAKIKLDSGDSNNILTYPIGQATISESDAFALQNQVSPTFQTNRIQAQSPTEITTDYGRIIILDLKNGTYLFKFIGNANTTTDHTIITTLDSSLIPRSNLDVWAVTLTKPMTGNIGNIRIGTNGQVDAKIVDPFSTGQTIIVL